MARPPKPYRRLPGSASNAMEHLRLYLAADHLLLVASTGFTESYKRFFFRDIQSIRLKRTSPGMIVSGVLGFFIAVFGLIGASVGGVAQIVMFSIAGLILGLMALNIALGPTCVCEIQTAVQTRRIPPLGRLRRARKVIAQIKPLIESAQETVAPAEIARRIDALRQGIVLEPESLRVAPQKAEGPGEPGPT